VALRLCSVSFKSVTGISHSVDVEAETLYEAAAVGLSRLKKDRWIEGLGPGTRLEIQVREPGSHHVLSIEQVERWINSVNASPAETLRKATLPAAQVLSRPTASPSSSKVASWPILGRSGAPFNGI
jgi:hypothetical protein